MIAVLIVFLSFFKKQLDFGKDFCPTFRKMTPKKHQKSCKNRQKVTKNCSK
jgi:hypothetical protein